MLFGRIGNRSAFHYICNNRSNPRYRIGFIMCLVVYVLYITSGNSRTTASSTSLVKTSITFSVSSASKLKTQSAFDSNHQVINSGELEMSPSLKVTGLVTKKLPSQPQSATNNKDKTEFDDTLIKEVLNICYEQYEDKRKYIQNLPIKEYDHLPIIYFVTPTYPRYEQFPEITRLGHTLMHIPRIHWIIANDCDICNKNLDYLFLTFGIPFTHLSSPMPDKYRKKLLLPIPDRIRKLLIPKGVANRRAGLKWLRHNNHTEGILYFGDDDNTYNLKLFSEIRNTKIVSMFPVGLVGEYAISTPIIKNNKVIAFYDSWNTSKRKWHVDMAGFAVNLKYLSQYPNATMPYTPGYQEDGFLCSIQLHINDIEPRANNATEVLVWHTQTERRSAVTNYRGYYYDSETTNLGQLFKVLESLGVIYPSNGVRSQNYSKWKTTTILIIFLNIFFN